jgi:hypothetical protein
MGMEVDRRYSIMQEQNCETCGKEHECRDNLGEFEQGDCLEWQPKQPTSGNNMYYGWIIMPDDEFNGRAAEIVKECEIFLKQKNQDGSYDCEITEAGIIKLDKYWGECFWGLKKQCM